MAQASTVTFAGVVITLESTTTPGSFAAPCGLTERSLSLSKETSDTTSLDCDDEDDAAFVDRDPTSKSGTISGEGVMARESVGRWRAAFDSDLPTRARVTLSGTAAQGGATWEGFFHLTSFETGSTRGERVTVSVELQSTGLILDFSALAAGNAYVVDATGAYVVDGNGALIVAAA